MTKIRWVQLICMLILWLLPAAVQFRNWKHADTTKKPHHWITVIMLSLWIIAGSGLAWATWKDFSRKERAPAATFYVNNFRVGKDTCIVLPFTNTTQELIVSVRNDGDWPMDGLELGVIIPENITLVKSDYWTEAQGAMTLDNSVHSQPKRAIYISGQNLTGLGDYAQAPPFSIGATNFLWSLNEFSLSATAKNAPTFRMKTWVCFQGGITNGYVRHL